MTDRSERERARPELSMSLSAPGLGTGSSTGGSHQPAPLQPPSRSPASPTSPPAQSIVSGGLAFLPNLFGRRTSSKTHHSHVHAEGRKASAASSVTTRDSFDDQRLQSPPAASVPLPSLVAPPGGSGSASGGGSGSNPTSVSGHNAAAFNLESALALMEPGAVKNTAQLVEIVKATSVHLANVLLDHSPDTAPPLTELGLKPADVRTIYTRAIEFAAPQGDYQLRTAALRLLAVLLGASPPRDSVLDPHPVDLPHTITRRSIYRLITAPSGGQPGSASTNQIFVEVAALKALSREGTIVEGMEGIVGWLQGAIKHLTPDWTAWCATTEDSTTEADNRDQPFGPIKSANPAAAASAMIDLTAAIVEHRIALFTPGDLTLVVRPMVEFLWHGIMAAAPASPTPPSRTPTPSTRSTISRTHGTHGRSQPASAYASPAPAQRTASADAAGSVKRTQSLTVGRVEPFPTAGRMSKSPTRLAVQQVKWVRPFKSLCAFVHMLFETTTINDDLFDEVFELLCFVFGQDTQNAMMAESSSPGAHELIRTMLGIKSGRRGELALRKALEGKLVITKTEGRKSPDVERKVARGAVVITRLCCQDDCFVAHGGSLSFSFPSLASSLVAAQSTSRYPGVDRMTDWLRWNAVDTEILSFLEDHLSTLEASSATDALVDDAWTEGEAACEVLDGMLPLVQAMTLSSPRLLLKAGGEPLVDSFAGILQHIPRAIGRLHSRLHTSSSSSSDPSANAPPPTFYHPKYTDLLLDLSSCLDEETAGVVIDYYRRECLCLPFTSGWIKNIWRLLEAFGLSYDLPIARVRVSNLLYHDIYEYVDDLPEHRAQLVSDVMVPYLSRWLPDESDEGLLGQALNVLVRAAVSETMEMDDDRRRARALKEASELETEDASILPGKDITDAVASGSFDNICKLLIKTAVEAPCKSNLPGSSVSVAGSAQGVPMVPTSSASSLSDSRERSSREGRSRGDNGGLRNLMRALSPQPEPTSRASGVASVANLLAPPADDYIGAQAGPPQHLACKSLEAVKAMIAIFTRLAFSSSQITGGGGARPMRTPASSRCITIYRDLLSLLYPLSDQPGTTRMPARCPRARLAILQWLMRLRADRKHRILFRDDINRFVQPFAANLFRTKDTEEVVRAAMEAEETRRRRRDTTAMAQRGGDDERGRSARVTDSATRSRSRSKVAGVVRAPTLESRASATPPYNPLWCLPETLAFETPPDNHPSEGMTTYDPNHPSLRTKGAPLVEGVWLPVSEYVRALNGILRWEHDWELVSYVLCFLPQQLGNKHFFHGIRATREIKGLLRVLCEGILETNNRWEHRFHAPSFIKRTHINSAAYQSLSILISYRSVFDRGECDALLMSLVAGLESNALLAKPCVQALTICIYELDQYVSKHLLSILQKMQQILSTPAVAVHILEFLVALGNSTLYRNFTDDQYRLVFSVAVGYISEHNARTDQNVDFSEHREAFTLSQHVIGLAYHAVYLWFMALKVAQRPLHVRRLIKNLLHAKSQRGDIDERTEVCFDWLARYTYGNADPKPATSFLNEMVMRDDGDLPRSESWVLGNAIITVTSHQRTGWATISTTRATGQTSVVCKLENVPLLDIGEDNADLVSLPAFLMANREQKRDVNDGTEEVKQGHEGGDDQGEDDSPMGSPPPVESPSSPSKTKSPEPANDDPARAIVNAKSPPPAETDKPDAADGYVWSGIAPSQRRKDVVVQPSYMALQLLSSYPNPALAVPRGRPIPHDPKFERALRGIENTPVINTFKIAVLYVGPNQTNETEILGNVDGSPLYLDFLAGLGRVIRLKGQVDVYTGGLDREADTDGKYAYAWWDDLAQIVFHAPTLMPNLPHFPEFTNKKRLVGNDYVKIVYNESGQDFAFDTIKTAFNFINIVISPYAARDVADAGSLGAGSVAGSAAGAGAGAAPTSASAPVAVQAGSGAAPPSAAAGAPGLSLDEWGGDSDDFFKVVVQRAPGIPDFSPIGEYKLVSRKNLPILVRQMAHYASSLAMRFQHTQVATDAASAEFITIWRARYRAIQRLRDLLPSQDKFISDDPQAIEEELRDFTRIFSPESSIE